MKASCQNGILWEIGASRTEFLILRPYTTYSCPGTGLNFMEIPNTCFFLSCGTSGPFLPFHEAHVWLLFQTLLPEDTPTNLWPVLKGQSSHLFFGIISDLCTTASFSLTQATCVSLKVLLEHAFRALPCGRGGGCSTFPLAPAKHSKCMVYAYLTTNALRAVGLHFTPPRDALIFIWTTYSSTGLSHPYTLKYLSLPFYFHVSTFQIWSPSP